MTEKSKLLFAIQLFRLKSRKNTRVTPRLSCFNLPSFQGSLNCSHLHISSDKYASCDWIVEHFLGNFCVMPPLNSLPKWFISLCITISYMFSALLPYGWLLICYDRILYCFSAILSSLPGSHSSRKFIPILNRIMSTLVMLFLSCYYFYSCPLILLWIAFMRSILKNSNTFSSLVFSFLTLTVNLLWFTDIFSKAGEFEYHKTWAICCILLPSPIMYNVTLLFLHFSLLYSLQSACIHISAL